MGSMKYLTMTSLAAIWLYFTVVVVPVGFTAYGFSENGWRGAVHQLWLAYQSLLQNVWKLSPILIPTFLAHRHPDGSPGKKVFLSVVFAQFVPRDIYQMLSGCARYTLSTYLNEWITCTASVALTIVFLVSTIYTYDIGWPEINFVANMPVRETLKATPMYLLRIAWGLFKFPVSFWYIKWWELEKRKPSVQDEEMAEPSIDEKGDLAKHVAEDHAARAEQDKYLQEKTMEDFEA